MSEHKAKEVAFVKEYLQQKGVAVWGRAFDTFNSIDEAAEWFNTELNEYFDWQDQKFFEAVAKKAEVRKPLSTVTISDGFGSEWETCHPNCSLTVVRPGEVDCNGEYCEFDR